MLAVTRDDGTTLSLLPVFHANLPAVLSRAHPESQRVFVVQLHAVGAGVDVARFRITIDQSAARPEVAATVIFVKAKRRKLEEVDVSARQLVLKQRRGRDFFWCNR